MNVLMHLAHEHLEFRWQEIKSIANLLGMILKQPKHYDEKNPFLVVNVPSENHAIKIAQRSVLIKSAIEVWVQADSYTSFYNQLATINAETMETFNKKDNSFRIKIEAFNKQLSLPEKIEKIEQLTSGPVNFEGTINLKDDCDVTYYLLEYYERIGSQSADMPSLIYFGRWICDGQREVIKKYDLSKRKFIGNTSMDPTLSMVIANMAQITEGSLVFDPFVGTGSLLVSCAHYGGYVMGSDIDYNLITGIGKSSRAGQKWRSKEETIRNNLKQYNLECKYIDTFIADASLHNKLWRSSSQGLFDAIITDPPYGIREPTTKLGLKKEPSNDYVIQPDQKENHIPCKKNYNLNELLCDLLCFSAKYLTIGGRLVYWMPVCRKDYTESNVPLHECLCLVSNCEQVLNNRVSRRLITMEKVKNMVDTELVHNMNQIILERNHYEKASFRERYFKTTT